jgi:glycosyltransferase involved in cell wall biosynthesis
MDIWIYPTYFQETNCIGALECQRDGVVPCTIDLAGLKDTVGSGVKIEGDIYKPETRIKFIDEIVKLAKDKKRLELERKKGKEFIKDFSWEKIAAKWIEQFK